MQTSSTAAPIRTATFDDPDHVAQAIGELRQEGFERSAIKVVCSDAETATRFREYIDERPAGARTPKALTLAALVYGALALIGLSVAFFASATTTLIVVTALLGVALLVTFGSTMMTRGAERELSDYYSSAVIPGQILLAVDLPENAPPHRISAADRILERFTGSHAALDHEDAAAP
jgi:hypothetical protein